MIERARKIGETFKKYDIAYLFIGKFAAILYGYPGTTQDIDIFPKKEKLNCERLVKALISFRQGIKGSNLNRKGFHSNKKRTLSIRYCFCS